MAGSENKVVLSYNDSIIYESDLRLLDSPNWLNDRIIGFVYEYFEYEKYKELVETNQISFVNPSVAQLIKLSTNIDEVVMCFLDPLKLNDKNYVLLPVNDNTNPESIGGSHWSCILIDKCNSSFTHFDSYNVANSSNAKDFYKKLKTYFKCNQFLEENDYPQQTNTSDCGVYLLAISDLIANTIKSNDKYTKCEHLFDAITPKYIKELRNSYKNLIISLSKK